MVEKGCNIQLRVLQRLDQFTADFVRSMRTEPPRESLVMLSDMHGLHNPRLHVETDDDPVCVLISIVTCNLIIFPHICWEACSSLEGICV